MGTNEYMIIFIVSVVSLILGYRIDKFFSRKK